MNKSLRRNQVSIAIFIAFVSITAVTLISSYENGEETNISVYFNGELISGPGRVIEEKVDNSDLVKVSINQSRNPQDVTPPQFTALPTDTVVECNGCDNIAVFDYWISVNGSATATDDNGIVLWSHFISNTVPGCGNVRTDTVGFIASDPSGNSDTAFAAFTIIDTEPPIFNVTSISYVADTLISSTANWKPDIPKFDPSLGTLQHVEMYVKSRYIKRVRIENLETSAFVIRDTLNAYLLYLVNPTSLNYSIAINEAIRADTNLFNDQQLYAAFDGVVDFAGPSGSDTGIDTLPFFSNCNTIASADGADLGPYMGTDELDFWFVGIANSVASGSGNLVSSFMSLHNIDVEIKYVYMLPDPPVDTLVTCYELVPSADTLVAYDLCSDTTYTIFAVDSIVTMDSVCANQLTIIRKWTTIDACGNDTTYIQKITVRDTIPPILIQPVPSDTTVECIGDLPFGVQLGASDNCSDTIRVFPTDSTVMTDSICLNRQRIIRQWFFIDECGNQADFTQTIYIVDTIAPVITSTLPMDITVQCTGEVPSPILLSALDNCNGMISQLPVDSVPVADSLCLNKKVIFRTWTFSDTCSNTTVFQQQITVLDTSAPTLLCPGDITINCPDTPDTAMTGTATATDGCGGQPMVTFTDSIVNGTCSNTVVIFRKWTAIDTCNNDTSCTQRIVVQDITSPIIICPADVTIDCPGDTTTGNTGVATAMDECNDPPFVSHRDSLVVGSCINTYTYYRIWTATDACGNDSSCIQTIFVQDTTPPMLTCPADVTLNCPADTSSSSNGMAVATDLCDNMPVVTYTDSVIQGNCTFNFTILRRWQAVDICGNVTASTDCIQTLVSQDTTSPMMNCPPDITLTCPADTAVILNGMATAIDACGDPNITYTNTLLPGNCPNTFILLRMWIATDSCGNSSSCLQTITVEDVSPPVISCPNDITLDCPADTSVNATGEATAIDECSMPTLFYVDTIVPGGCLGTFIISRTWTAIDSCGNDSSCVQTIMVRDITPPLIICPADITIDCPNLPDTATTGVAIALDVCDSQPAVTFVDSIVNGNCNNTFTIFRTWTAIDACNNDTTCVQSITIQDITSPIIICPADVTLDCPGDTSTANTGTATATDQCNNPPVISYSDSLGMDSCAMTYTLIRIWTATDDCGNDSSCIQMIFIQDTTPPILVCPADVTLDCPADTSVSLNGVATAFDLCDNMPIVSYSDTVIAGNCAFNFTILRSWIAIDACGNLTDDTACVQLIMVQDTTAPTIICPADITLDCPADTSALSTGMASGVDECGQVTMNYSDIFIPGNCPSNFILNRRWVASDACGNTSECTQTISIIDVTAPMITCPVDMTLNCPADTSVLNTGFAAVSDQCGIPIISYDDFVVAGACPGTMTITRTWTVVDSCGNDSSCIQVILVQDTTAPMIVCPDDVTINCPADTSTNALGVALVSDDCGMVNTPMYADSLIEGSCENNFTLLRRWTVSDACGNVGECYQSILVQDTTPPTITCPADVTLECPADTSTSNTGIATAQDGCNGNVIISYADQQILTGCQLNVFRTWLAADACGNSTSCLQRITIQDTTAPMLICPADLTLNCPADTSTSNTGIPIVSDGCSNLVDISYLDQIEPGNCMNEFTVFRIWMVFDDCLNLATCTQRIIVKDTIAPAIVCPIDVTLNCPADTSVLNTGLASTMDGCAGMTELSYTDLIISGDCVNEFMVLRTFIATDLCGNSDSCTQQIMVIDTTSPDILCPPDAQLQCPADTSTMNLGTAIASDLCGASSHVIYRDSVIAGSCASNYTLYRIWTAFDSCGNPASCIQQVVIQDTTSPTIVCPADMTLDCPADTSVNILGSAVVTDDCSPVTMTYIDMVTPGACPNTFELTRTWMAIDLCGNTAQCVQRISVVDTSAPVLFIPADVTLDCGADTSIIVLGMATGTDGCQDTAHVSHIDQLISGNCPGNYQIERIWILTDACDNIATDTQSILIIDTIAPLIACPPAQFVDCDSSQFSTVSTLAEFIAAGGTVSESCCLDTASLSFVDSTTVSGDSIIITRTFTISDCCGNIASCQQLLIVYDALPPMAMCQDTVCLFVDPITGIVVFNVDTFNNGSTDNCGIDSIYINLDTFECPDNSNDYEYIVVTLYVVDATGNIDSCMSVAKIACLQLHDLALVNQVDDDIHHPGDTFDLIVTIYNQAGLSSIMDSISIIHYLPPGICVVDSHWVADTMGSTGSSASITISVGNGTLPSGGLIGGQSVQINMLVTAKLDIYRCGIVDYAEIKRAVDINGFEVNGLDLDSPYDMDNTNDAGGMPQSPADDYILGTGTGVPGDGVAMTDEDDHDPAVICILPMPILSGNQFPCPGETHTYTIGEYAPCNDYTWHVSGGGSIQGMTDSTITIRWIGSPGSNYQITLTEDTGFDDCQGIAFLNVTIQDDLPLACNDNINISLGEDCLFVFTADFGLEAPAYDDDAYVVELFDENGILIPNATLTGDHIGQQITYVIRSRCYETSCWGYVNPEDKMIPDLQCHSIEVACTDNIDPGIGQEGIERVLFANVDTSMIEQFQAVACAGGNYSYWRVIDLAATGIFSDLEINKFRMGVEMSTGGVAARLRFYTFNHATSYVAGQTVFNYGDLTQIGIDNFDTIPALNLEYWNMNVSGVSIPTGTQWLVWELDVPGGNFVDFVMGSNTDGESTPSYISSTFCGISDPTTLASIGFNGNWISMVYGTHSTVIPFPLPDSVSIDPTASYGTFVVSGFDPCGDVTLTFMDENIDIDCVNGNGYTGMIIRHWRAVDESGNTSICADTIRIKAESLLSISLPGDRDNIDQPALVCQGKWDRGCDGVANTGDAGEGDGIPQPCELGDDIMAVCDIWFSYVDLVVDDCGLSKKIYRDWYVLDKCTGEFIEHTQLIIIQDVEGPVITCPVRFDVNTPPNGCEATWQVPAPPIAVGAYDGCSGIADWSVTSAAGTVLDFGTAITIVNLPIGCTEMTYFVLDSCGNESSCLTEICVMDQIPPVAICDVNTQVSLDATGRARIYAATFDDGSYDNCGLMSAEVRRTYAHSCWNDVYGPYVEFCCDDISESPIEVELRVTDLSGNTNSCWLYVLVEDKLNPVIVCPPDISVSCDYKYDLNDLSSYFGKVVIPQHGDTRSEIIIDDIAYQEECQNGIYTGPLHWGLDGYAADNCELTVSEISNIDLSCGIGVITRIFTAIDDGGRSTSCIQRITISNCRPFQITDTDSRCRDRGGVYSLMDDVEWPCDLTLEGCSGADTDPLYTGRPIVGDTECGLIADTFTDEVFTLVDDACFKILRHWSIIDWCQEDPNSGLPYRWDYTQVIKVIDDASPVITPRILTCDSTAIDCSGRVDLTPNIEDCTPASHLTYWWRIDLNDDGSGPISGGFDLEGNDANPDGPFPYGTHRILWEIEDMCGNRSTMEYPFEITDCKKPSPVCINGLSSVVMPSSGQITVWAVDFDASSFDNCDTDLDYRIWYPYMDSMNYPDQSRDWQLPTASSSGDDVLFYLPSGAVFYCEALGDGVSQTFTIRIYVVDDAGNWDYCTTHITMDDNDDVCPDNGILLRIAGNYVTEDDECIDGVMTNLTGGPINQINRFQEVNDAGHYNYYVTANENWSITGEKNDDYLNGVTAQDLSLIQRHISGIQYLNSNYKIVAADANSDRDIDIRDVLDLRRLLLGVYDELPLNTSWRSIDADYNFPGISFNQLPPDVYEQRWIQYTNMQESDLAADFVGVKIGDVDGDVIPNSLVNGETRNDSRPLGLNAIDQTYSEGSFVRLDIKSENFNEMTALQLTFEFDPVQLEWIGAESGRLQMVDGNFGKQAINRGLLPLVWYDQRMISATEDDVLFTLIFKAKSSGRMSESIHVGSNLTKAIAFSDGHGALDIQLDFDPEEVELLEDGFTLFQNNPNPFLEETQIGYILPENQKVILRLFDAAGNLIGEIHEDGKKGYNEFKIKRKAFVHLVDQIVYYQFETNGFMATKKMLLVK